MIVIPLNETFIQFGLEALGSETYQHPSVPLEVGNPKYFASKDFCVTCSTVFTSLRLSTGHEFPKRMEHLLGLISCPVLDA
jgi:hypothetical protein